MKYIHLIKLYFIYSKQVLLSSEDIKLYLPILYSALIHSLDSHHIPHKTAYQVFQVPSTVFSLKSIYTKVEKNQVSSILVPKIALMTQSTHCSLKNQIQSLFHNKYNVSQNNVNPSLHITHILPITLPHLTSHRKLKYKSRILYQVYIFYRTVYTLIYIETDNSLLPWMYAMF